MIIETYFVNLIINCFSFNFHQISTNSLNIFIIKILQMKIHLNLLYSVKFFLFQFLFHHLIMYYLSIFLNFLNFLILLLHLTLYLFFLFLNYTISSVFSFYTSSNYKFLCQIYLSKIQLSYQSFLL